MTPNNVNNFKLTPEGDGWQIVDFTISNPTSSNVQLNLFNVNAQTPIPSDPNLLPPTIITATLSVGTAPLAIASNTINNQIYCCNSGTNTITVIDGNTTTILTTITVSTNPAGIAFDSTNNRMYVSCTAFDVVYVINCSTNTVLTTISVSPSPSGVAYNTINNRIYVGNFSGSIDVIDCVSNTVIANIVVGNNFNNLAYNKYNNFIYAPDYTTSNVYPINCATNAVGTAIPVGTNPWGICYNSTLNKIYTANSGSDDVSVIDCSTNTVTSTIAVAATPRGIAFDVVNNQVYEVNYIGGNMMAIDCTTDTVIATISGILDSQAVAYHYNSNGLFVANQSSNLVYVVAPLQTPYITATSFGSYFQFIKDQATNPKKVRQLVLIGSNSQISQTMNFVYTTMTGINFQRPILPNLSVTQWMPNNTIASVDFGTKKASSEFTLDEHTYLKDYTVLANTTVTLVLYFKDLVRGDMLEMANELPLLHCSKLELDNCKPDAVEKTEKELEDFGEPILTVDDIIAIEENKIKIKNRG